MVNLEKKNLDFITQWNFSPSIVVSFAVIVKFIFNRFEIAPAKNMLYKLF